MFQILLLSLTAFLVVWSMILMEKRQSFLQTLIFKFVFSQYKILSILGNMLNWGSRCYYTHLIFSWKDTDTKGRPVLQSHHNKKYFIRIFIGSGKEYVLTTRE